ncbi:G-type lectin S-receptor-like serine/threonine-protein kinase RKS1 isoform X1 [Camellia sinensis]|uniref:G-type lectin S-receptor-like serine/threonine-protein kinase RKS1 isoform X1 n=2 Tax=Camellia sinensis TaxID=4442 RepID=UPI0010365B6F|nr:G-type lectin S-receptor-like serine/threonine-protein kinase RKS1 isoform X1 [Camellia sinensis]
MMNPENWVFNIILPLFLFFGFCKSRETITPTQPIKDGDLLVSNNETFALGFFSPGNGTSNRRYVGIWYHKISKQTVVWVANRDNPINGTSGAMSIDQHGNLVIYSNDNSQNVILWHTNVSAPVMATSNSHSARLLDSGNLMLLFQGSDTKNESFVAWQSFDYPTNTLLPNMKLGLDRRTGLDRFLTSWKLKDDPGTGEYSYRMVPSGLPQLVLYKGSVKLHRILPGISSKLADNSTNFMFNLRLSYIDDPEEVTMAYVLVNGSSLSKIFVEELVGRLKMDTWVDVEGQGKGKWVEFYSTPNERCDNYGLCGAYSYCDDSKLPAEFECTCLPGYEPKSTNQWNLRDASGGCVEKGLGMCRNGEGFVKVEGEQIPDTSWAHVVPQLSMNECEAMCLMNCSCKAYTSVADSGCITWYGDLMDVRKYDSALLEWYIRVDADELGNTTTAKENNVGKPSAPITDQHLKKKKSISVDKKKAIVVTSIVVMLALIISLVCRLVMKKARKEVGFNNEASDEEKLELSIFDMITIAAATNKFSDTNKIGEGGFGPVYKGQLSSGKDIAVKRLSTSSKQGVDEFKNEVILIAKLQHRNLVRLLGCCIHGEERMLVYEYMPHGSLDSFIFGVGKKSKSFTWSTRLDIIVGIARGILYLHQDSRLRIIHRDLKASNVLLDSEMNPKISDFGLARAFGHDQSSTKTERVVGTYGYMPPEYAIDGLFSMKSDVFSFGVIILEIMSGKRNRMFHHSDHDLNLLGHAWNLWTEGKASELLDPLMEGSFPMSKALRCIEVGLLCVQKCPKDRPMMSSVFLMLVSDSAILPQPKQPGFYIERSSIETHDQSLLKSSPSINEVTMTCLAAR